MKDNKTSKRTATHEQELKPIYTQGNAISIKTNNKAVIVFAFEKFIIPNAKSFLIEVSEKNGGRHLLLKIKNKKIIKAVPLAGLS